MALCRPIGRPGSPAGSPAAPVRPLLGEGSRLPASGPVHRRQLLLEVVVFFASGGRSHAAGARCGVAGACSPVTGPCHRYRAASAPGAALLPARVAFVPGRHFPLEQARSSGTHELCHIVKNSTRRNRIHQIKSAIRARASLCRDSLPQRPIERPGRGSTAGAVSGHDCRVRTRPDSGTGASWQAAPSARRRGRRLGRRSLWLSLHAGSVRTALRRTSSSTPKRASSATCTRTTPTRAGASR